jgi:hypothetical protein
VSTATTKRQIVLNFFARRGERVIQAGDLYAGRSELRRQFGPGNRTSLGYVASVLREAGYDVRYEDRYSDPLMPEPYASRLKGMLEFHDLASAESSLVRLDAIHREYSAAHDPVGEKFVYAIVKQGKLRARSLAANPRVQASKRLEKQEIAAWFQVWLETPALFADWLILRKGSEDFRSRFAEE